MKQLIINALTSLATGLFFIIGMGLAAMGYDWVTKEAPPVKELNWKTFAYPEGVVIVADNKLPDTENYTVSAVIENASDKSWGRLNVTMTIYSHGEKMSSCVESVESVSPNEKKGFLVECHHVSGKVNVTDVSYKLEIEDGSYIAAH